MGRKLVVLCVLGLAFAVAYAAYAWTPVEVDADPLVRMPGTQPGQGVALTSPGCL
jgi:hypothetical protein